MAEEMGDHLSRPSPDPTELTRLSVNQAVAQAKDYTDGRIAVIEQRLNGMDEATKVLDATVTQVPTDVQESVGYLNELTQEKFDGLGAVMDEQRRGLEVAEQEREKAAKALRIELARAIDEGDRNLREHIAAQVAEIRAALVSSDLLEQERMARVAERVDAERRITELTREMGETAILKAERAADKRFDEFAKVITVQVETLRATTVSMTERLAAKL